MDKFPMFERSRRSRALTGAIITSLIVNIAWVLLAFIPWMHLMDRLIDNDVLAFLFGFLGVLLMESMNGAGRDAHQVMVQREQAYKELDAVE